MLLFKPRESWMGGYSILVRVENQLFFSNRSAISMRSL